MSHEAETAAPRVVATLDGSALSEKAVPLAAMVALGLDRRLHLLYVLDPDRYPGDADRERAKQRWIEYARELAERRGLEWDEIACVTRLGNAAEEILDYLTPADLLVIASHGRSGFKAMMTGSVSNKVIRGAPCPVLVVPGNCSEPGASVGQVVIALDGSEAAEVALHAGRELANALDAAVLLVGAYRAPPPVTGLDVLYYDPAELLPELRAECERYLRSVARPSEQVHAVEGDAPSVLVEAVEAADGGVLAIATRGRGLAKRMVLGSVTEAVVRAASRPILVVPVAR
ncbi:MAG: universal stress protein [Dehalococcoidia bacterium]